MLKRPPSSLCASEKSGITDTDSEKFIVMRKYKKLSKSITEAHKVTINALAVLRSCLETNMLNETPESTC